MKKILWIFLLLSVAVLITFALFGDYFDFLFSGEKGKDFFQNTSWWSGPAGAALLISDLFLPIPTTVIIGAMGAVMGVPQAAFWGWLGLSLAGFCGYGLARWGSQHWADKLASPEEQLRYQALFNHWGGLAVILSRMLPILPEVLSVLAGLYGMRFRNFAVAVTLGSVPPALAFAWIGRQSLSHPGAAAWGLVLLTALLWGLFVTLNRKTHDGD